MFVGGGQHFFYFIFFARFKDIFLKEVQYNFLGRGSIIIIFCGPKKRSIFLLSSKKTSYPSKDNLFFNIKTLHVTVSISCFIPSISFCPFTLILTSPSSKKQAVSFDFLVYKLFCCIYKKQGRPVYKTLGQTLTFPCSCIFLLQYSAMLQ